ncbi:hypothetical protein HIM_05898 [Hirsutella minnesotensis 3608]|uniref:Extracellular membrane protein CFEM domain-containing protein n=1 Tax=Hirsutella minnesotensis 3608 TaxID=1043627 RepID=A0A0F7ZJY0_9HYPO|nr:hypothetical protein HIM_05898 [Hirsutella minnesotensis 3608]
MKCQILALLLSLSLAAAAPAQSLLKSTNDLLPWHEPGGCSGSFLEECMGTAMFCALQDEQACLKKRQPPPSRQPPQPSDAEIPLGRPRHSSLR